MLRPQGLHHAEAERQLMHERKPVTAKPVGKTFAVRTRGREERPMNKRSYEGGGGNAPDYNTVEHAPGCYRRVPTTRDQ